MSEKVIYQVLMWGLAVLAAIAAITTVVLLAQTMQYGLVMIIPAILTAAAATACCYGATYYGSRIEGHKKVFSNEVEQEVLNFRQRRDLKIKRGEIVFQRAMIEIENERDNMIHRQIEASKDPDKPPHATRFGNSPEELKHIKAVGAGEWLPANLRGINDPGSGLKNCCVMTIKNEESPTAIGDIFDCAYETAGNRRLIVGTDGRWMRNR